MMKTYFTNRSGLQSAELIPVTPNLDSLLTEEPRLDELGDRITSEGNGLWKQLTDESQTRRFVNKGATRVREMSHLAERE